MKVKLNPILFLKIATLIIILFWAGQQLRVQWQTASSLGKNATFQTQQIDQSFISNYQNRYAGLDTILKPNGRYMYKSDSVNFPLWANNYIISQYSLAPAILLENQLTDTLLFNLYYSQDIYTAAQAYFPMGYKVFYSNSFGVFLLNK